MFETSLIESSHHKIESKKVVSLPVSVLIHGLVIGAVLGASIWFVGEVPEPPIPVTFYAAGNAANGTGGTDGDKIYTTSVSATEGSMTGVDATTWGKIKMLYR